MGCGVETQLAATDAGDITAGASAEDEDFGFQGLHRQSD
jgi:hypothetical protein